MRWVPIGDIVTVTGGGTPRMSEPSFFDGDIPWVTPKDMKQHTIDRSAIRLSPTGVANSPAKIVDAGSTLVVVRSGVLKHTLPVAIAARPVALNQDMKALSPKREFVTPEYLVRLVKAQESRVLRSVRATTADNFPIDTLLGIEIPLPPLPEQRRIAAILDEADALRARASNQALALDEFDDRMFEELLGSQVAQREWTLEDVLEDLRYGTSVKSGSTGVPVLRIPNVSGRAMDTLDLKTVDLSPTEVERLRLIDRDVLFVRSNGNPDVVGRCSAFSSIPCVNRDSASWVFASYLIRGRLREGVEPEAIVALTRSRHGRRHLRSGAATSAGQYNINTSVLRAMPVFDPSSSKQREYADFVRSTADERQRIRGRASELDELFASLQHRAFRGEL